MTTLDSIAVLKVTRQRMLDLLNGLSMKEALRVPEGFNNHIFWNLAHSMVTQQLLCYTLSGVEPRLHGYWIDHFRKGTASGQVDISEREWIDLKQYLVESPLWLEKDYEAEKFGSYQTYETSYGVTLHNLDDAIAFNQIHEGLHLGYAMAQRKMIK